MDIPSNSDDHYGDFESSSDEEEWSSSDDSLISDMGAAAAILGSTRRSQWVLPVDNRKKKRPRAEPEIMPRPPNILHQLRFRECQHKFKRKHMHIQKWPAHTYFLGQVAGARGCVNALKWSLNGEILVSAGDDTVVRLHRFRSGFSSAHGPQLVSKMSEHVTEHFDNIFSCILLERDQLVVSSSRSGQVFMYDPTRGNLVRAFRFGEGSKLACRPYSQPSAFWSCSHNGLVVQHDIRAGAEAARGGSHIVGQAMTEINCRHMVRGSTADALRVSLHAISASEAHENSIAVGGEDSFCRIFDVRMPGRPPVTMLQALQSPSSDLITGECPLNLSCPKSDWVALSPDGCSVAYSYSDGDIFVDTILSNSKCERDQVRLSGHVNRMTYKGCFFLDADTVASGSDDGRAYLWSLRCPEIPLVSLHADSVGAVNVVCPNPVRPLLATSGLERTVKLWSSPSVRQTSQVNETQISALVHDEECKGDCDDETFMDGKSCSSHCHKRQCVDALCIHNS